MSKTDEDIVREALGNWFADKQVEKTEAFSALDRLMARCVPELPDGWQYGRATWEKNGTVNVVVVHNSINEYNRRVQDLESGHGPNIRAACTAALAKIGEKP